MGPSEGCDNPTLNIEHNSEELYIVQLRNQ